jgi:hypothetical protein
MRTPGKLLLVLAGSMAACTSTEVIFQTGGTASTGPTGTGGVATTGPGNVTATGVTSGPGATSGSGGLDVSASGAGTGAGCNQGNPNADIDGDGWTPAQGDCNDCDPDVNPGAIDTPGVDGDCDGVLGSPPAACDDNLALDDADPINAARAVELCTQLTDPKKWGLKSATWVLPDGQPPPAASLADYAVGHGMLPSFGPNVHVQAGKRMLGLSSGTARQPTDPDFQDVGGFDKGYTSGSPMGFPKESPSCPGVMTGQPHDGIALEVVVVAPTNARGFSFRFDFFTSEWPSFTCSIYNDFFVASLLPIPMGQPDGNISTDVMGNPISVNNAFLDVCGCMGNPPAPCLAGGKSFACALGDAQLTATGFGKDTPAGMDHGSTGWLESSAPVQPHGEITLRWSVYDSSDGVLDTTTLVDDWRWITTPGVTVATKAVP